MKVTLLSWTYDPEKVIATAAKVCYAPGTVEDVWNNSFDYASFIEKLKNMGHMSPFEHANFTWGIDGISRACSHQLVRHRIASFSQQSQRYVKYDLKKTDLSENYVCPEGIQLSNQTTFERYVHSLEKVSEVYEELVVGLMEDGLSEKESAENARYILPNAMKTNLVMTMNARELMHFFELRCCRRAQDEINQLSWVMLRKIQDTFPTIFSNCGPNCLIDKCKEGKMSCGRPYQASLPNL